MELPSYDTLLVEQAEQITTIAFNRPEKRNALSPRLHREMYDLLNRLEGDEGTRVLILTGTGPAFCAGQDMKEFFHDLADQETERQRVSQMATMMAINDAMPSAPIARTDASSVRAAKSSTCCAVRCSMKFAAIVSDRSTLRSAGEIARSITASRREMRLARENANAFGTCSNSLDTADRIWPTGT